MVVPGVHLGARQPLGEIGWQFAKSVGPRAGGVFQALKFIDRHQHVSATATMRDRNWGDQGGILHLTQTPLELLRAKLLKYPHIPPHLRETRNIHNSQGPNNQLHFVNGASSFSGHFPADFLRKFQRRGLQVVASDE
jgi:hypothetical protein